MISDDWTMCSSNYGTYHDCPTEKYVGAFAVSAHNPSAVVQNIQRFKVAPSTSYSVEALVSGEWTSVDSNLECFDYQLNGGTSTKDCTLFINSAVKPNDFGFYFVTPSAN